MKSPGTGETKEKWPEPSSILLSLVFGNAYSRRHLKERGVKRKPRLVIQILKSVHHGIFIKKEGKDRNFFPRLCQKHHRIIAHPHRIGIVFFSIDDFWIFLFLGNLLKEIKLMSQLERKEQLRKPLYLKSREVQVESRAWINHVFRGLVGEIDHPNIRLGHKDQLM